MTPKTARTVKLSITNVVTMSALGADPGLVR